MQPLEPPHSLEAEQSVLGGLLLNASAIDRIEWLQERHFYSSDHRTIFRAIRRLAEAGKQVDILLVDQDLQQRADQVNGGLAYLGTLCQLTPSAHNITRYAEIVRDKALRRDLMLACREIAGDANNPAADPMKLAETAEAQFMSILNPENIVDSVTIMDAMDMAMEAERIGDKGMSTGYEPLDRIVGGLRPGELIVIAGRPGFGKSSLALGIGEHCATAVPVYLWTGEMSARQIGKRSFAYHSRQMGEFGAIAHASQLRLQIDPNSPMSIGTLRLRLRRHKRRHGLGLVVIDYLQLLMGPKSENRNQEVGAVSRGLKAIAKEFNVPVILMSSLNRGVEGRTDKRPTMSDLRESGDIESDADVIMMVYRDSEYNPASAWRNIAEIIVRKHREGPTGTAYLEWLPDQTRFVDYHGEIPAEASVQPIRRRAFGGD